VKSKIVGAAKWAKDHTIGGMMWIAGMTKNEPSYDDMTIELRRASSPRDFAAHPLSRPVGADNPVMGVDQRARGRAKLT
jgi:hypothetical protein